MRSPASGGMAPEMVFSSVDLPAPLGPSTKMRCPFSTVRSTLGSSVRLPLGPCHPMAASLKTMACTMTVGLKALNNKHGEQNLPSSSDCNMTYYEKVLRISVRPQIGAQPPSGSVLEDHGLHRIGKVAPLLNVPVCRAYKSHLFSASPFGCRAARAAA